MVTKINPFTCKASCHSLFDVSNQSLLLYADRKTPVGIAGHSCSPNKCQHHIEETRFRKIIGKGAWDLSCVRYWYHAMAKKVIDCKEIKTWEGRKLVRPGNPRLRGSKAVDEFISQKSCKNLYERMTLSNGWIPVEPYSIWVPCKCQD
jgi:hypothetical protein